MTEHRPSLTRAVLLSAGVNVVLALAILWTLAVTRGLGGVRPLPPPAAEFSREEEEIPEVTVVVTPVMEAPAVSVPPEKRYFHAPENQPATPPENAARFFSDRDMRAAAERAPDPEGLEGLATKDGIDAPMLDLRDTEFQDGEERPPPAAETASTSEKAAAEGAEAETTPPENSRAVAETRKGPSSRNRETTEREPVETDGEEDSPESAPRPELAFRDSFADTPETLVPEPKPVKKTLAPSPLERAPRLEPVPPPESQPLRRIPDRLPDTAYRSGQRKAKSLGTISNRGDAASVDAVATAEGKFGKILHGVIEKSWHHRRLSLGGLVNRGMVTVEFEVDRRGRISNVRLANPGEANPVMEDCALTAVIHAKLPPPPPELIEDSGLNDGKFPVSFSFILY